MKKQFNQLTVLVSAFTSMASMADGFRCVSEEHSINVNVFNSRNLSIGTRSAAIMVVSDPSLEHGNQTIARFRDASGTLSQVNGTNYEANVDLRFADSARGGEYLLGTRLNQLDQINLEIDFSYAEPVAADAVVSGRLIATKRNGDVIWADMECTRYLVNP